MGSKTAWVAGFVPIGTIQEPDAANVFIGGNAMPSREDELAARNERNLARWRSRFEYDPLKDAVNFFPVPPMGAEKKAPRRIAPAGRLIE